MARSGTRRGNVRARQAGSIRTHRYRVPVLRSRCQCLTPRGTTAAPSYRLLDSRSPVFAELSSLRAGDPTRERLTTVRSGVRTCGCSAGGDLMAPSPDFAAMLRLVDAMIDCRSLLATGTSPNRNGPISSQRWPPMPRRSGRISPRERARVTALSLIGF